MYYAMVMAAVVMFGLQFFCNQQYEREWIALALSFAGNMALVLM